MLPEEWIEVALEDLVLDPKQDIVDGPFGSRLKASEYTSEGVPIIRLQNIDRYNFIDKNINYISPQKAQSIERHSFQNGDIVITKLGDPLGKACIVPKHYDFGIIVADVVRFRLNHNHIDLKYIMFVINSESAISQFEKWTKGTTRPRVNLSHIRGLQVPLPPFSEQKFIASKLDEILVKTQSVQTRLENVSEIIKRTRQAILTAAVSGKLTENWRLEKKLKSNVKAVLPDTLPFMIPDSWCWSYFGYLGELSRGKSKHRPRNDKRLFGGKYPFIQTGDVANSDGKITSHNTNYSDFGLAQSRLFPKETLCITIAANIADTAILTYPACFPDSIVGFIANESVYDSTFALYYIQTIKDNIESFAPGSAQKNINLAILNKIPLPVPPISEQKEIVHNVEILLERLNRIDNLYKLAKEKVDRITQNSISKAFRGELTESWRIENRDLITGANSAEALLKKIREERKNSLKRETIIPKKIDMTGGKMKQQKIVPIVEALELAKKSLNAQELLSISGYPDDASTQQLEGFFLDIREQMKNGRLEKKRLKNEDVFSLVE